MKTQVHVVYSNIPLVGPRIEAALARAVQNSAKAIQDDTKASMRESKSGRTYIIGGRVHTASAPGESPAVFSGELIGSITAYEENTLTWIVPAEGKGAMWEYGMFGFPARPYFRPAANKEFPEFERNVKQAIRTA